MNKKLIALTLVISLCIGLLPVIALADTPAKFSIRLLSWTDMEAEEGGKIAYLKNAEYQGYDADGNPTSMGWKQVKGDENNWNAKLEWPAGGVPTLTLKDAKMVMVGDDGSMLYVPNGEGGYKSQNSVSAVLPKSGSANCMDLNMIVEGENVIKVNNGIVRGTVGDSQHFKNITITGKNGGKISGFGGGIGISARTGYNLTLDGLTLDLKTTTGGGSQPIPLRTEKGNMYIKDCNITCGNNANVAIGALYGGNILVENSTVNVTSKLSSTAGPGCFYAQSGSVTISGDKTVINATGKNNPCIFGETGIIINGGQLNLNSAYYALYPGKTGDIQFNGGTTAIIAQNACYEAPTIAAGVKAYVGPNEKKAEIYDGTDPMKSKQPWMLVSDKDVDIEITEPPTLPPLPTTPPTVAPTQMPTSAAPTTLPTGVATPTGTQGADSANGTTQATTAATNATNATTANNTDGDSGDSTTLLIVAAVVIVAAAAVVVVIITKRKKA